MDEVREFVWALVVLIGIGVGLVLAGTLLLALGVVVINSVY